MKSDNLFFKTVTDAIDVSELNNYYNKLCSYRTKYLKLFFKLGYNCDFCFNGIDDKWETEGALGLNIATEKREQEEIPIYDTTIRDCIKKYSAKVFSLVYGNGDNFMLLDPKTEAPTDFLNTIKKLHIKELKKIDFEVSCYNLLEKFAIYGTNCFILQKNVDFQYEKILYDFKTFDITNFVFDGTKDKNIYIDLKMFNKEILEKFKESPALESRMKQLLDNPLEKTHIRFYYCRNKQFRDTPFLKEVKYFGIYYFADSNKIIDVDFYDLDVLHINTDRKVNDELYGRSICSEALPIVILQNLVKKYGIKALKILTSNPLGKYGGNRTDKEEVDIYTTDDVLDFEYIQAFGGNSPIFQIPVQTKDPTQILNMISEQNKQMLYNLFKMDDLTSQQVGSGAGATATLVNYQKQNSDLLMYNYLNVIVKGFFEKIDKIGIELVIKNYSELTGEELPKDVLYKYLNKEEIYTIKYTKGTYEIDNTSQFQKLGIRNQQLLQLAQMDNTIQYTISSPDIMNEIDNLLATPEKLRIDREKYEATKQQLLQAQMQQQAAEGEG